MLLVIGRRWKYSIAFAVSYIMKSSSMLEVVLLVVGDEVADLADVLAQHSMMDFADMLLE